MLECVITLAMLPGLTNLAIGTGGDTREAKRPKMQPPNSPVRFRFFLKGEIPDESVNDLKYYMTSSFYNYLSRYPDLVGVYNTAHLSVEIIPKNTLTFDYWGTPITEARFALSGEGTDYLLFIDHAENVNDPSGWLKYAEFMEEIFSIGPIRQGDMSEPIQDKGNFLPALYDEVDNGPDPLGLGAATKESPNGPDDTEELTNTHSGIKRLYSPSVLDAWDNWSFNYNNRGSEELEDYAGDPEEEAGEEGFGELSAEGASVFFPDRAAEAASSAADL